MNPGLWREARIPFVASSRPTPILQVPCQYRRRAKGSPLDVATYGSISRPRLALTCVCSRDCSREIFPFGLSVKSREKTLLRDVDGGAHAEGEGAAQRRSWFAEAAVRGVNAVRRCSR